MMQGIYAILDTLTNELVGGPMALQVHKHEAAAIRFFADILRNPGSIVANHPNDHALVKLADFMMIGEPDTGIATKDDYKVVMTASQMLAAQGDTNNG